MGEASCKNCGALLVGVPGTRVGCPACGTVNVVSAADAQGRRTFQPEPPRVYVSGPVPVAQSAQTFGPSRRSKVAVAAFILGVAAYPIAFLLTSVASQRFEETVGLLPLGLSVAMAIAAIVLGAVGIHQANTSGGRLHGKGLAVTGMVLGIVFIGLMVVAILFVVLVCAAVAAAYVATVPSTAVQGAALAVAAPNHRWSTTWRVLRTADFRAVLLSHHPHCGAFQADVIGAGTWRVCASCVALASASIVGFGALVLLQPSADSAWKLFGLGLSLAVGAQLLSLAGWTTSRIRKVGAKAIAGIGVAEILFAFEAGALAPWVRGGLFLGAALLAILLSQPRRSRLRRQQAHHAHDDQCAPGLRPIQTGV